jgi:hypothetical protein
MSESFEQWLERNMPAGTVIGDPLWWAPKIRKALQSGEPVAWQFYQDGEWYMGMPGFHRANTIVAGFATRDLYTAQQAVVPEGYNEMLVEYIRDDFQCLQGADGWCFIDLEGQAEQLKYLRDHGLLIQHPDDLGRVKIKATLPVCEENNNE